MDKGWDNFETCDRKSLNSNESSEESERQNQNFCHRECIYCHEQSVERNIDLKSVSGKSSEENEYPILNWRRVDCCYINGSKLG